MNLNCMLRRFCLKTWNVSLHKFIVIKKRNYGGCKTNIGPPWNVLFFGTDSFALYSLRALWAKLNTGTLLSSLAVVSKRGCLVRKFAEEEGLIVYDWPLRIKDIESKFHIGMVVSFGKLIPENVIKSFPLGCVNVHASLLPRWRGAAPIIHAVSHGDIETGITIMRIHPHKFDTGEIVRQYRLSIDPHETAKEVEHKLGVCGSNLLMECLRDLPRCLDMAVPQPKEGVTYAPKVDPGMAIVDWRNMSSLDVYNLHRALQQIYPLTTRWHGQPVKLHELCLDKIYSDPSSSSQNISYEKSKQSALDFLKSGTSKTPLNKIKSLHDSGHLFYDKRKKLLKIVCADGNHIVLQRLSLGGKKLTSSDFYNGFMSKKSKEDWKFQS